MKKLKKLKLNQLSKNELENREMQVIRGGSCSCVPGCGCLYEGEQCSSGDDYYGGSSSNDNARANGDQLASSNYDSVP